MSGSLRSPITWNGLHLDRMNEERVRAVAVEEWLRKRELQVLTGRLQRHRRAHLSEDDVRLALLVRQ